MPGVWEIVVDASRRTPTTNNPFRVTAAVQGVVVDPQTQTVPTATVGAPVAVRWSVENRFGAVSYTHLDVYKRQTASRPRTCWATGTHGSPTRRTR